MKVLAFVLFIFFLVLMFSSCGVIKNNCVPFSVNEINFTCGEDVDCALKMVNGCREYMENK